MLSINEARSHSIFKPNYLLIDCILMYFRIFIYTVDIYKTCKENFIPSPHEQADDVFLIADT